MDMGTPLCVHHVGAVALYFRKCLPLPEVFRAPSIWFSFALILRHRKKRPWLGPKTEPSNKSDFFDAAGNSKAWLGPIQIGAWTISLLRRSCTKRLQYGRWSSKKTLGRFVVRSTNSTFRRVGCCDVFHNSVMASPDFSVVEARFC